MRRLTAIATGAFVALIVVSPVSAGPITGDTVLLGAPVTGTTLDVEVSIDSVIPVVAYEYAIQNECDLGSKGGRTVQHDDIVYWTFEEDGTPHAVMPVYLQSIPAGTDCEVFLMRGNTKVKGSTTEYTVEEAPAP
jgi:hypothetical protein